MHYQRVNEIEQRLERALDLLIHERPSAGTLTKQLGVSRSTVFRLLNELRRRGFRINSVHEASGWRYQIIIALDSVTGRPVSRMLNRGNNSTEHSHTSSNP